MDSLAFIAMNFMFPTILFPPAFWTLFFPLPSFFACAFGRPPLPLPFLNVRAPWGSPPEWSLCVLGPVNLPWAMHRPVVCSAHTPRFAPACLLFSQCVGEMETVAGRGFLEGRRCDTCSWTHSWKPCGRGPCSSQGAWGSE